MKKNKYPYQLELPFAKNNYKNNINTLIISEFETSLNQNNQSKEQQSWHDPILPSKKWDKRPKKKFYAVVWVNDHELEILKVFATSEIVAKKYLNENFCLNELYYSTDFPTDELNKEIIFAYQSQNMTDGEIFDA